MIQIINELITSLSNVSYSAPNVSVKDFYSISALSPPQITVEELPSNDGVYIDNQPCVVRNGYVIEVYARQAVINGTAKNSKEIAMQIIGEVDAHLNEVLGFTMSGAVQVAPYTDSTICRVVARYTALIDKRTNKIYRRI